MPKQTASNREKGRAKRKRPHKSRTAVEFPVPRRIPDVDFNEICVTFKVPAQRREALRRRLDQVADFLIRWMQTSEKRRPRSEDRQNLERARAFLGKAQFALRHEFGPVGTDALRAAGETLTPALDRQWLFNQFEDKEVELLGFPPELPRLPHSEFHPPAHVPDEEWLRRDFCSTIPGRVLISIVTLLENSLTAALNVMMFLPGAVGGRAPKEERHLLLVNLADIFWEAFGAKPTTGASSRFLTFASAVFAGIGWEGATERVQHAVPKALSYWKKVTKNNHGISNSSRSE